MQDHSGISERSQIYLDLLLLFFLLITLPFELITQQNKCLVVHHPFHIVFISCGQTLSEFVLALIHCCFISFRMAFRDFIDFATAILSQQPLLRAALISFSKSINIPCRATNIVDIRAGSPDCTHSWSNCNIQWMDWPG